MEYIIFTLILILIACVVALIIINTKNNKPLDESEIARRINESTVTSIRTLGEIITENQKHVNQMQNAKFGEMNSDLKSMQQNVSLQLEKVYKSFGEMHSMAQSMTDLKKMLSNVKTRGILGEIQLSAILDEILSPEQYDENVATIPNSLNRVEFAIRLPADDDGFIYLPIDSKFPLDAYINLQDACESGDSNLIADASKVLVQRIKQFAKDIHTKYVESPYTTDFAIMFLPLEGLYAEVINRGLVEILQREYKVNVAGPSTMAAMLNSLQMGFKTLALEKRSSEVWELLGSVKTEFSKFASVLETTKKHLMQAEADLENLIGVRTRSILKKLDGVERLDSENPENEE